MKQSDLIFTALLVPLDFCMLVVAGLMAYVVRFRAITDIRPVVFEIPFFHYLQYEIGGALFFLIVFALSGLYSIGHEHIRNEFQKVTVACSAAIMLVVVFIFLRQEFFSSRFIVLAVWILSIVCVMIGRLVLRGIRSVSFRHGYNLHQIALIGTNEQIQKFTKDITSNPSLGYIIVYAAETFSEGSEYALRNLRKNKKLDELILLNAMLPHAEFKQLIDFTDVQHIGFRYSADVIGSRRLEISQLAGIPIVEIKRTRLEGWWKIIKRIFDFCIALFCIVFLFPMFILIMFLIKCDSSGPIFYRNRRVGPHGFFDAYKFRSMYTRYCTGERYDKTGIAEKYEDSLVQERNERIGPVFKVLNDPRRTRIGRILERTSLDELPQLFNVLDGTMSLVGPRPHMPKEVAGYKKHHHQLFSVKPGITGLAQISGRSDLDFDDEAKIDLYYVQNWSLLLDGIILLKTPFVVLARRSRV